MVMKKRTSQKWECSDAKNNTAIEKTKRAKKPPLICPLPVCGVKDHKIAISKYCKPILNQPKYDPNYVPPPTGKFFTFAYYKYSSKLYKFLDDSCLSSTSKPPWNATTKLQHCSQIPLPQMERTGKY